jgi:hypothetical protein
MSLRYGAVNSDRLTIAASGTVNSLTAWTNIGWFRPSGFGGGGLRMWAKQSSSGGRHAGAIGNSAGVLTHDAQRATTDAGATSSTALLVDTWQCVAFTYDETDGTRIFIGTHNDPMSEVLYSSRTVGSGATEADAGNPLYFGNRDTLNAAFLGQIQEHAHFGWRMSLDEMQAWQRDPSPVGARVFIVHGQNGTGTQTDLTGNANHGTVTGATVSFDRPEHAHVVRRRQFLNAVAGSSFQAAWARNANTVIQSGVRAA